MKRILVITGREIYPLWGGDRLRIFQICKYLSRFYELDLVSLTDDIEFSYAAYPELADFFVRTHSIYHNPADAYKNVLRGVFSKRSIQETYYSNKALHRYLIEQCKETDYVLCHLFRMEQYLTYFTKDKTVVELTDSLAMNYSRLTLRSLQSGLQFLYFLEKNRIRRRELDIVNTYNRCCVISEPDYRYLIGQGAAKEHLHVFNNGVNYERFPDCYSGEPEKTIVFIGNLKSRQNLDACFFFSKQVMPRLLEKHPGYTFKIIGNIDEEPGKQLTRFPYNTVTGRVDDVSAHIGKPVCAVCPIQYGAGIQNKILEYFASGLPVVSSPIGAEGFVPEAVNNLRVALTPGEYVANIDVLINGGTLRKNLSEKGRMVVRRYYSWDEALNGYEQLFTSV